VPGGRGAVYASLGLVVGKKYSRRMGENFEGHDHLHASLPVAANRAKRIRDTAFGQRVNNEKARKFPMSHR
jgi:hypothetical protein